MAAVRSKMRDERGLTACGGMQGEVTARQPEVAQQQAGQAQQIK
jgi:hypothetical protein